MKLLRSMLFTPGNNMRMICKAGLLGADAIILDLEDAVPLADKETARLFIRDSITQLARQRSQVFVRINALTTGLADDDLDWIVQEGLAGIVLPKAESASEIQLLARMIAKLEDQHGLERESTKLVLILETARGVHAAQETAAADSRIIALAFGAVDFARDMGINLTRDGAELLYARSYIAIVARAERLLAIDTPCIDVADRERLAFEAKSARQLGFRGKLLVHPSQVSSVNQIFSPTEDEVAYARKIVAAFRDAETQGFGAILLDGKMIDVANYRQAVELIALADAVARMERN